MVIDLVPGNKRRKYLFSVSIAWNIIYLWGPFIFLEFWIFFNIGCVYGKVLSVEYSRFDHARIMILTSCLFRINNPEKMHNVIFGIGLEENNYFGNKIQGFSGSNMVTKPPDFSILMFQCVQERTTSYPLNPKTSKSQNQLR